MKLQDPDLFRNAAVIDGDWRARSEMTAAEMTAASWPMPSLSTQLSDAASGSAGVMPTPTASRSDCVAKTPPALLLAPAAAHQIE